MEKIKTVFFDLDGTLINSIKDIALCINHTLKYFNFNCLDENIISLFVGNGAKKLLSRCVKYSLITSDLESCKNIIEKENFLSDKINSKYIDSLELKTSVDMEKIISYYLNYYSKNCANNTILYDGVQYGLEKLKNKNINMFVLSNKPHKAVIETVKKLNIDKYFLSSIGDGLYNAIKPSYELWEILSKKYSLSNKNSVIVGDGLPDFEFSKNASITPLIVLYGKISKREDLLKLNCNYYFESFFNVVDFIISNS